MPRFLATSFIALALIVSAAGVAHAQTLEEQLDANAAAEPYTAGTYASDNGAAINADISAKIAADKAAAQAITENKTSTDEAYNGIMSKIMSLFAWLVGVAAITLDNAVYYTVVKMGSYVNDLSAIGVTWRILRDIGNIFLIFGFLAVGVTTILNVDWYGGGKKMLPMMLVAAVFLNFSLFISEALIDTSNLFATQFYQQINGGQPAGEKNFDPGSLRVSNEGISNKIMGQLGMQTIYGKAITNTAVFQGGSPWFIGFMGIILFIVTAFVLFSLAFVLISRFVILIFLIILSPAAFAGLAIPGLKARMMSWWQKLFEQVMTAPILLLMLYIALAIITDAQFLTGFCIPPAGSTDACRPDWLGFITSGGSTGNNLVGFGSMMMSFLVAMGLLLAVVIQSKNLSAFGASKASALAGKLTFGATAFGLRSTVGWGSQGAAQALRRTRFGASKYGRVITTTLDKGAKASFDIRGTTAFGGLKAAGIEAGEAQKGGYRARRDAAIKGHQEYVKSVGEAITERGPTKRDIAVIEEEKRKAAETQTAAKSVQEAAEQRVNEQKAELARLERQQAARAFPDAETEEKIAATRQNLATSEKGLATAAENLKDATNKLTAANKKEAEGVMKGRIATRKEGYAESIKGSFPGWVMFGPGGSAAARKIKLDVKKTPEQQLLENLKKAVDSVSKEGGKPEETKPAEAH